MTTFDNPWLLSERVVGAFIQVHRQLGPGLLESAYEACLAEELRFLNVPFERQVPIHLTYRGTDILCGYRADFVIQDELLVELKVVERLDPIHVAQTLTYLKLTKLNVALLVNFNALTIQAGLRRLTRRDRRRDEVNVR